MLKYVLYCICKRNDNEKAVNMVYKVYIRFLGFFEQKATSVKSKVGRSWYRQKSLSRSLFPPIFRGWGNSGASDVVLRLSGTSSASELNRTQKATQGNNALEIVLFFQFLLKISANVRLIF